MLKLQDEFGGNATSETFISNFSEPINVMATGDWGALDACVLTLQINPDPQRETVWETAYQDGSTVTLSATNNIEVLTLPGGVHCRLSSSDVASVDLNLWVGGEGVTLPAGEAT